MSLIICAMQHVLKLSYVEKYRDKFLTKTDPIKYNQDMLKKFIRNYCLH